MSDRPARRGPMTDGLTGSRAAAVWAVIALDLLALLSHSSLRPTGMTCTCRDGRSGSSR